MNEPTTSLKANQYIIFTKGKHQAGHCTLELKHTYPWFAAFWKICVPTSGIKTHKFPYWGCWGCWVRKDHYFCEMCQFLQSPSIIHLKQGVRAGYIPVHYDKFKNDLHGDVLLSFH